ncbi:MAG: dihydrofolate reductase [Bacteroidales bacterium]|nr:dihydrofolate reductase [Bacteroidales bacterium]
MISIIVAIAENNAIGKDNKLLCHIPGDLKRFKKLTTGKTVIMGLKTFKSLPNGPLPNRRNIVITDKKNQKIDGCDMAYSIEEAVEMCNTDEENFVIGGGSIYRQFLPLADKLYITKVHHNFDADTFFPEIDYSKWKLISSKKITKDVKYPFSYLTFVK